MDRPVTWMQLDTTLQVGVVIAALCSALSIVTFCLAGLRVEREYSSRAAAVDAARQIRGMDYAPDAAVALHGKYLDGRAYSGDDFAERVEGRHDLEAMKNTAVKHAKQAAPPPPDRRTEFVILMMGGSVGSSWLTELLNSHPNMIARGEIFQNYSVQAMSAWFDARRNQRKILAASGFKIKQEVLRGMHLDALAFQGKDRWPAFRSMLRARQAKLICLFRRNFVKHAISEVRHSQQYEVCHGWEDHTGKCSSKVSAQLPLKRVVARIWHSRLQRSWIERECSVEQLHLDAMGRLRVMQLAYEDLAYAKPEERRERLNSLQRWLGVAPTKLWSTLVKLTPPRLADVISNLDNLTALVATRYGRGSIEWELLQSTAD